jgi:hypothetical protein
LIGIGLQVFIISSLLVSLSRWDERRSFELRCLLVVGRVYLLTVSRDEPVKVVTESTLRWLGRSTTSEIRRTRPILSGPLYNVALVIPGIGVSVGVVHKSIPLPQLIQRLRLLLR